MQLTRIKRCCRKFKMSSCVFWFLSFVLAVYSLAEGAVINRHGRQRDTYHNYDVIGNSPSLIGRPTQNRNQYDFGLPSPHGGLPSPHGDLMFFPNNHRGHHHGHHGHRGHTNGGGRYHGLPQYHDNLPDQLRQYLSTGRHTDQLSVRRSMGFRQGGGGRYGGGRYGSVP